MSQINKPSDYFNTVLWTATGSAQTITGVGFNPDLVWNKARNAVGYRGIVDRVRGDGALLFSDATNAEDTSYGSDVLALENDGFSVQASTWTTNNYVTWNWLAGGTASSNTDGSITSQVSANTTSGFSIVSYTGNATGGATVGHGLGVAPSMIIVKKRNVDYGNWQVYHSSIGNTGAIQLNLTNATGTAIGYWNNTSPTSSVFSLGAGGDVNGNTQTFIAYCFAEKKGFSKFGSYTGNGSDTNGTFIYTGFKPAWVMTKKITDSTSANWLIQTADGLNPYNPVNQQSLRANLTNAALNAYDMDFLSNGIKMYNDSSNANEASKEFIYMAFAENPLVGSNNVCATAR